MRTERVRGRSAGFPRISGSPSTTTTTNEPLRRLALGRNSLGVGDDTKGANVAGLQAPAAPCTARSINPMVSCTDVIGRVGDHPVSWLDELLAGAWADAQG
jgi:hypothetical protein